MFTRLRRRWTPLLMVATIAGFAAVWLLGCSGESIGEALATASGYGSSGGSGSGGGSWSNTTPSHIHTWGDWVVTTQATCDVSGVETRTCTQDNSTETRVIPKRTCGPLSYGGRTYKTVVIGGKRWMAENLNYVPGSGNSRCYNNDNSNCNQYGRLYDWATAGRVCPTGWHLPSSAEWGALAIAAGGTGTGGPAGTKLKSRSGWNSNGNGTDDYGFSALPGGLRFPDGDFSGAGYSGYWWTANENGNDYAHTRSMHYYDGKVGVDASVKGYAMSVRCLEN
jgi:uncharacterized protein (TIGR02145 family)